MAQSVMARPDGGPRTWTVIDEGYRTVGPVEEWLEAHRHLWSPNTVRGYATALSQWWTFLEQRAESGRWNEVGVPTVSAFVSWMRNGRRIERSLVPVALQPLLDRSDRPVSLIDHRPRARPAVGSGHHALRHRCRSISSKKTR